jgi:hypothetical protein
MSEPEAFSSRNRTPLIWGGILLLWFVALCVIPDPRPLGAPAWAVSVMGSVLGLSESSARVIATIALRGAGLAILGVILSLVLRRVRMARAAQIGLVGAPLLAILAQWINYGYFPIFMQWQVGVLSAILGSLLGLALRKSRVALAALVILPVGLFAWGTSTGIPDDLYEAARATAVHVIANTDDVPKGDAGWARVVHVAFTYAEDNSHGTDGVLFNRAAILALGVILGEEKVAWAANRPVDSRRMRDALALRRKITLHGRGDTSMHFWVSAALGVLSDEDRSLAVGITKEMMDAQPGGSGFSFADLAADRAGTLFARAATRDAESASGLQARIRSGVKIADYCPDVRGLPEGIPADEFQSKYGGLGGAGTAKVVEDIKSRLAACEGLR